MVSIGLAKNRNVAINYLIRTHWINSDDEFYDDRKRKMVSLKQMFGDYWKEEILKQDDTFF